MTPLFEKPLQLQKEHVEDIEKRFQRALPFYKERGSVLFISDAYRFFEPHGFVQQSVAKVLTDNGVMVHWIDGLKSKNYKPTLSWKSILMSVGTLPRLPFTRLEFLGDLNISYQANFIKSKMKQMKDPLIWVQAGLDDRVAAELNSIDIFSVFDDPYRHSPEDDLCKKAKLITCQNQFATTLLSKKHSEKVRTLLPPVEMGQDVFKQTQIKLPDGFPKKIMGYIGTFFPDSFDMVLLEDFIRSYPDYGFILLGRTNAEGNRYLEYFKRYPNFHYLGWTTREKVADVWKLLSVSLLLYRPSRISDGAFPTKILESLHFGVPCVATQVPKTSSLEGIIPRSSFSAKLKKMAIEVSHSPVAQVEAFYEKFAYEMNPKLHLAKIAEFFIGK